jgi:hypothetical protein
LSVQSSNTSARLTWKNLDWIIFYILKIENKGTSEIALSYIRIVNSKEGKLVMQKVI